MFTKCSQHMPRWAHCRYINLFEQHLECTQKNWRKCWEHSDEMHVPITCPLGICWEHFVNMYRQHSECSWWAHFKHMTGSHASCEQDVTDGHIWDTYTDYIPNVNRMFLLGKCWAKCLNPCNVLSMFPPKSRYPHPQCLAYGEETSRESNEWIWSV